MTGEYVEYARQVVNLLVDSRIAREVRRHVKGLPDKSVEAQLRDARLRSYGHPFELRERLLRYLILDRDPGAAVPWMVEYDEDVSTKQPARPLMCSHLWEVFTKRTRAPRQTAPGSSSTDEDSLSERIKAIAVSESRPCEAPAPAATNVVTCFALPSPLIATTTLTTTTTALSTALATTAAAARPIMSPFTLSAEALSWTLGAAQAEQTPRATPPSAAHMVYAAHYSQAAAVPGCIGDRRTKQPMPASPAFNGLSARSSSDGAESKYVRRSPFPAAIKREHTARKSARDDRSSKGGSSASTPESDADSHAESRAESRASVRRVHDPTRCAKALRDWGIKFSGQSGEDADEFLALLGDFRKCSRFSDEAIFGALLCVLSKDARFWFRNARTTITSWRRFKRAFRDLYCTDVQQQDLEDELRRRTQGKGESISKFIACFQAIINYFERPPSKRRQVEMAYAQLRPEYRRFMSGKRVDSFADIIKHGKAYERNKIWDERFMEPPSKDKALIPGAAFAGGKQCSSKVAAVREEPAKAATAMPDSVNAALAPRPANRQSPPRIKKTRRSRRRGKGKSSDSSHSSSDAEVALLQTAAPRQNERMCIKAQGPHTYTAAVRSPPIYYSRQSTQSNTAAWPNANASARRDWTRTPVPLQRIAETARQSARSPFYGLCHVCQVVGHRAAECPKRACYTCGLIGHSASACPWRQQSFACQICKTRGVTFDNCPNCTAVRQFLESVSIGQ